MCVCVCAIYGNWKISDDICLSLKQKKTIFILQLKSKEASKIASEARTAAPLTGANWQVKKERRRLLI